MKKVEILMTVLVLGVAFASMYFLFAGFGLAAGNYVEVVVSGSSVEPSEFRMYREGVIGIKNTGDSVVEVEILRGNLVGDKIDSGSAKTVWRNKVSSSRVQTFDAVRGNYLVRTSASGS